MGIAKSAARVNVSFNPKAGGVSAFRVRRRLYITLPAPPPEVSGDAARYAAELEGLLASPREGWGLGLLESIAATVAIMLIAAVAPGLGEVVSALLIFAVLVVSVLEMLGKGKRHRREKEGPGEARVSPALASWLASVAKVAEACRRPECTGTLLALGRVYSYRVKRSGTGVSVELLAKA